MPKPTGPTLDGPCSSRPDFRVVGKVGVMQVDEDTLHGSPIAIPARLLKQVPADTIDTIRCYLISADEVFHSEKWGMWILCTNSWLGVRDSQFGDLSLVGCLNWVCWNLCMAECHISGSQTHLGFGQRPQIMQPAQVGTKEEGAGDLCNMTCGFLPALMQEHA